MREFNWIISYDPTLLAMIKNEVAVKKRWIRVLYIISPLLILIACLGFLNLLPRQVNNGWEGQFVLEQSLSPSREADDLADSNRQTPTSAPPIETLPPKSTSALATAVPPPPDAKIQLLGPPENSSFSEPDSVALYWQWPILLHESHNMAVYLRRDGEEILMGVLNEPNIGDYYRWELDPKDILGNEERDTVVSVQWLIRLESTTPYTNPILESEGRNLSLLP